MNQYFRNLLSLQKLKIYFQEKLFISWENLIGHFSLVGNPHFLNPQQFDWVKELESDWLKIRQELDRILLIVDELPNFQDISPEQQDITQDNRWKSFFLYGYGFKIDKNCQRCPETTKLIEKIPGMKTAFFSILLPHKEIPEHQGYYKGIIRYHLGLVIPKLYKQCGIQIGNEVAHWEEGKSLLFDDTFTHQAWNKTDEMRVVLFIDVIRPLPFPLSFINKVVFNSISTSPFVEVARKNQAKWDKRLEKSLAMVTKSNLR